MNYKLLLLALTLTSSLGAMNHATPLLKDGDAAATQQRYSQIGDGENQTCCGAKSEEWHAQSENRHKRVMVLGLLALLSFGSLAANATTMAEINSDVPNYPRIAQLPDVPPSYPYDQSNLYCDSRWIACTTEDNKQYLQICEAVKARNTTNIKEKRRRRPRNNYIYEMENVPTNCNDACASVANQQDCVQEAMEQGAVFVIECDLKEGSPKYQVSTSISTGLSGIAAVVTSLFLTVEARICGCYCSSKR